MNKFNFDKILKNVQTLKRNLPIELANETKNYFMSSFKNSAWDGKAWDEVQRRKQGTKAFKYAASAQRTKSILSGRTGMLKRAVSNSLKEKTFEKIRFEVTDVDYAVYHNEGTDNITQRQFIGDTKELRDKQIAIIEKQLNRVWQG
jgi:hypothetical protein